MPVNMSAPIINGLTLLRRANEQPQLALDLLNKSLQGLDPANTQQTSTSSTLAAATGKGGIININA